VTVICLLVVGSLCVAAAPAADAAPVGPRAISTTSGPSCSLDTSDIVIQDDNGTTNPGSISLIVQDATFGLKRQISPYHVNATRVFGTLIPGTTLPVESKFTQISEGLGSSGSLEVTNTSGQKTVCLGQFKKVVPGPLALATGFEFPSVRNNLAIQNSSADPLTSVNVVINGSCNLDFPLTPGQLLQMDMSNVPVPGGGTENCLNSSLNTVLVHGLGPSSDTGSGVAEAVVWGVGPFA
jgi:hypothetical protein